jgi:hypothetical protein
MAIISPKKDINTANKTLSESIKTPALTPGIHATLETLDPELDKTSGISENASIVVINVIATT